MNSLLKLLYYFLYSENWLLPRVSTLDLQLYAPWLKSAHQETTPEIVAFLFMFNKENRILHFAKSREQNFTVCPLLSATELRPVVWYRYQSFIFPDTDPISSQLRDDQFVSLNFLRSTTVYFPLKLVCRASKYITHIISASVAGNVAQCQYKVCLSLEDSSISLHSYMPLHAPRVNRFRGYHVILQSASIKT